MAVINHEAELSRAGANITGWWSRILFFTRRYPLGAVGALIVLLFVLTAVFANFIAPMDPTATNARASLAPLVKTDLTSEAAISTAQQLEKLLEKETLPLVNNRPQALSSLIDAMQDEQKKP